MNFQIKPLILEPSTKVKYSLRLKTERFGVRILIVWISDIWAVRFVWFKKLDHLRYKGGHKKLYMKWCSLVDCLKKERSVWSQSINRTSEIRTKLLGCHSKQFQIEPLFKLPKTERSVFGHLL